MFDEHRVLSHTAAVWLGTPLAAWQPITDQCTQQGGICRGEAGELPPHLTFPPTGLSENLGEWKGGVEGKGKGKGEGDHLPYSPPPHWLLPQIYHPGTQVQARMRSCALQYVYGLKSRDLSVVC